MNPQLHHLSSVPTDDFTPHGYLDNAAHTRNLHPSGVVRSLPGMGFGWHYPALPGGYGFREVYRAGLRLYLIDEHGVHLEPHDLPGLVATRHTKNEFRYRWRHEQLTVTATFFLVDEHVLACRVSLTAESQVSVQVGAQVEYTRHLGAAGVWGESGLVGRLEEGALVLQGFEDGEAFALLADRDGQAAATTASDDAFLGSPAMPGGSDHAVVTGSGRRGETVSLAGAWLTTAEVNPEGEWRLELLLARDVRRDLAVDRARRSRDEVALALAAHRAADERFWRVAPQLRGDWPESWRRGFVYDLETLRMMVRSPLGIYAHVWDAMQIQAPRVVLAEAAIDALLLSYADLATAKELLLGTFLDAPRANVPCSREDGSYNMVGANGSACGTAPEWGYPLRVAEHLYSRDGDDAWLEAIYPALERYLTWWEENRSDEGGYLVYDNSWESGQDLSDRFGPQKEGGGSTIREVRPVDLQAAMADACRTMAGFAQRLGRDASPWTERHERYRGLVAQMWRGDAYRDHDARVGWSDVHDVMQLAPVALGLAPGEHVTALEEAIARLPEDDYPWPMFLWTAVDAAHAAGGHQTAADIVARTFDRAYAAWDRRTHSAGENLPGVTCEYWGTEGKFGAEGYGWGAFGVHAIFRTLLGYRPASDGFWLRPNLPRAWGDGEYVVERVNAGTAPVEVSFGVAGGRVRVALTGHGHDIECRGRRGRKIVLNAGMGEELRVVTRVGES